MSKEVCLYGDYVKETFATVDQPAELYAQLKEAFPWVNPTEYFSISTPAFHEVIEEEVITCCLPLRQTKALMGEHSALTARKFCMQSKTSFLRSYELWESDRPAWLPACAKPMFIGKNFQEFGRPFNEKVRTFADYYFDGPCAEIEAHFNLPERRGAYETWYGVTVVGDEVKRVKQYVYDEENQFSDWDVVFLSFLKRIDRLDVLDAAQ